MIMAASFPDFDYFFLLIYVQYTSMPLGSWYTEKYTNYLIIDFKTDL